MVKKSNKTINKLFEFIYKYPITILVFSILYLFIGYLKLLHNSVMQICIFIITLGIFLYERTNNFLYLFLFVLIYVFNEILYVLFGFDIFF